MATENVNQSGASAAADSAKEETARLEKGTGPDSAADDARSASQEASEANDDTASARESADQEGGGETSGGDFGAMLENYEKESAAAIQEGEIVRGTVVSISDQNVLVDIGFKSEGIVPREEFLDREGNITVKRGEEVDVLIKSIENQDGYAILSRAAAVQVQSWEKLRRAHQNHETITGIVEDRQRPK